MRLFFLSLCVLLSFPAWAEETSCAPNYTDECNLPKLTKYHEKLLEDPIKNKDAIKNASSGIAVIYAKQGQFEKALSFATDNKNMNKTIWGNEALGRVVEQYVHQEKFDDIVPLLQEYNSDKHACTSAVQTLAYKKENKQLKQIFEKTECNSRNISRVCFYLNNDEINALFKMLTQTQNSDQNYQDEKDLFVNEVLNCVGTVSRQRNEEESLPSLLLKIIDTDTSKISVRQRIRLLDAYLYKKRFELAEKEFNRLIKKTDGAYGMMTMALAADNNIKAIRYYKEFLEQSFNYKVLKKQYQSRLISIKNIRQTFDEYVEQHKGFPIRYGDQHNSEVHFLLIGYHPNPREQVILYGELLSRVHRSSYGNQEPKEYIHLQEICFNKTYKACIFNQIQVAYNKSNQGVVPSFWSLGKSHDVALDTAYYLALAQTSQYALLNKYSLNWKLRSPSSEIFQAVARNPDCLEYFTGNFASSLKTIKPYKRNRRRLPELQCLISSGKYKEILEDPRYSSDPDIINELAASATGLITAQNILELSEFFEKGIEKYTGYQLFLRSIDIVRYERYKLNIDDRKMIFDRMRRFLLKEDNYDLSRLSNIYDLYLQYNFTDAAKHLLKTDKKLKTFIEERDRNYYQLADNVKTLRYIKDSAKELPFRASRIAWGVFETTKQKHGFAPYFSKSH